MQTIQFIETARWVISQYSDDTQRAVFSDRLVRILSGRTQSEPPRKNNTLLIASHEIAIVRTRLEEHPFAPQVLRAFDLELLLDKSFPIYIADKVVNSGNIADEVLQDIFKTMGPIWRNWPVLTKCVEPIESLTVPSDVANEKDYDEILTIELRYDSRVNPQAKDLAEVLLNAAKLYEATCIASGKKEFDPLVVIYATSGTSFRFDLKGLGAPIKQLKEMFNDVWRNIRHRRAEDFRHNAKAIVEGLDLLSKVHSQQQKNILSGEDANRLKQQLNKSMLGLLEASVLTREIPDVEPVSNREIAQGIQQKLLPPAPPISEPRRATKRDNKRSSKKSTKKSSKKGVLKEKATDDEAAFDDYMNEDKS